MTYTLLKHAAMTSESTSEITSCCNLGGSLWGRRSPGRMQARQLAAKLKATYDDVIRVDGLR